MMDFNITPSSQLADRLGNMHNQIKSNSSDNPFLDVLLEEDMDEELIKYDSQAAGSAGLLLMDPSAMFHGSHVTATRLGAISCASSSISPAGSIFDDEADDDSLLFTSENDLPGDMLLTVNPVTSPLNSTSSIITSFSKALDFPSSVNNSKCNNQTILPNSRPHMLGEQNVRSPAHFRFTHSCTLTPDGRRLEPTLAELNSGMLSLNGIGNRKSHTGSSLPWDAMDCDSDEILAKIGSSSINTSTSIARITNDRISKVNTLTIKKEKTQLNDGLVHTDHQYGAKETERTSVKGSTDDILKNPYITYVPYSIGVTSASPINSTYQITVTTSGSSTSNERVEDIKPQMLANSHLVGNSNSIKTSKNSSKPSKQRLVSGGNTSAQSALNSILMAEPLFPHSANMLTIKSEPISVELNPMNNQVRPTSGGKICPSGTMLAPSANRSNALLANNNAAAMAGQIILTVSGSLPSMIRPADPSTSKASTSSTQSSSTNKNRTARKRNNSMSTECSLTSSHDEGFASNADESYSDQEEESASGESSVGQKPAKKVKRSPSATALASDLVGCPIKKTTSSVPSTTGDDSCSDDDDDDESFYGDYQASDLLGASTSDDVDNRWSLDMGRSRKSGQKRYFWQYNVQSKGPKGLRLSNSPSGSCRSGIEGNEQESAVADPHVLQEASDPVFAPDCVVEGVKHSGKARRGDGNDLTPNPRKLLMIGLELKKLSKVINCLTPVAEVPVTARNKTRKEKNKLASRACRLKKKAQHEANKIKLLGLQREHSKLLDTIQLTRQLINESLTVGNARGLHSRVESLVRDRDKSVVGVANHTADFVNSVLDKVAAGQNNGGLDTV